ncbi:MAG: type IV pilin protein [Alteromonadales bacterium]|nr:type IV pilin protein [Alteromonadales bacterium]
MPKIQQGFTLIELMIVVAIIGILSAIAYPSYQAYMQDGRRAEVQHLAFQQIAILERRYTREGGYPAENLYTVPTKNAFYTFKYEPSTTKPLVTAVTEGLKNGIAFKLTLTPKDTQSSDKCKIMTINEVGEKTTTATGMQTECWGS